MLMIEKMARAMGMALYERDGPEKTNRIVDSCWQDWIPESRAALTALLEPSGNMITAAAIAALSRADDQRVYADTFRAMIQAALDEKEG